MDKQPTGKRWIESLKREFVIDTVKTTTNWKDILKSAAGKAKNQYPDKSTEIKDKVTKYLEKSPAQEFLKPKAYQWLRYVHNNPELQEVWFPNRAVEVAHLAFRLKGRVETLHKYLSHDMRRKKLRLIPLGVEGNF